jgi:hypothetical protein
MQTEFRDCSLSYDSESYVLQFAITNIKIKVYRTIIFPVVL